MSFNYTKFLKEGGIEKNLQEAGDFGNDPQDRYNYVRKFTADLPDTARTEQMLDNLDDALEDYKMTDEVSWFDQTFVDIMIALGKENELMEEDTGEEIDPDYDLEENDDVLDEMIDEAAIVVDDFEVGDKVALNVAYQKANGNERMIPSEFKFRVVGVREVPKGGGGTYQDVSVERMSDGERVSYDNAQLARIEDQEMFDEMEGEVQSEGIPDVNTDFSVGTDLSAFDEAQNEMALEKAMVAGKLGIMQNDLEDTLSQGEIDTLSDAIVLLRKEK